MSELEKAKAELYHELGYKPLNKTWAKVEILLGLIAAGAGIMAMLCRPLFPTSLTVLHMYDPTEAGAIVLAGLALFVLGGYLALAGHRSHIHQSMNQHTALLIMRLRDGEEAR